MLKKTILLFFSIYTISGIVSYSSLAQTSTRTCTIKSIVGDVKVRKGKSPKWIKARPNSVLKESDAIRTFVESEVNLVTTEGSNLVIGENSTLELSDFSMNRGGATQTGVKILSGNVMVNVKKLVNKKSKFEFETPTAVAAIRGTRVSFDVLKSKTSIKVFEGKVYVSPKGSRKGAELKTNQMATVSKGQKEIVVIVMSEKSDENKIKTLDSLNVSVDSSSIPDSNSIRISDSTMVSDSGGSGSIVPDSMSRDSVSLQNIDSSGTENDKKNSIENDTSKSFDNYLDTSSSFNNNQSINNEDSTEYTDNSESLIESKKLELKVFSPENDQVVLPGSQLTLMGKVVPPEANVRVNGTEISISGNGEFRRNIPAPSTAGQYEIEIDAGYNDDTKSVIRRFLVKALSKELQLIVNEPVNRSTVTKPSIKVSGFVTPGAEITVSGISIPVASNGSFSNEIPIPDEEGGVLVEIEALLNEELKIITKNVIFKPVQEEIVLSVFNPTDKQIICTNKLLVKGSVRPSSINEISVNGTGINVRNGVFSGFIMLPGEQGGQEIEFEVVNEDQSKLVSRTVYFEPVNKICNKDIPVLQPTYMPANSKNSRLTFTVYDNTLFDELTVFTSIDGSSEAETGPPGSRFYIELEEGIHSYEIYAEDLCGNISQKVTGTVCYLQKDIIIRLLDPSSNYHVVHVPPSTPKGSFAPEFTVEFSVENLPDDNPKVLKMIRVTNTLTNHSKELKQFSTDTDFDFDIKLKRGINTIVIEVYDVSDRSIKKECTIEVR